MYLNSQILYLSTFCDGGMDKLLKNLLGTELAYQLGKYVMDLLQKTILLECKPQDL